MAEQHQHHPTDTIKSYTHHENSPTTSQILAVVTLFPVGGVLLTLSGLTLAGTLCLLAVATPLFLIFSPIIVPAVLTIALAVAGIITSGVFGITALSSVTWIINYFRRMKGSWPAQFDEARRRVGDAAGYVGQRAREAGQKAQDVVRP